MDSASKNQAAFVSMSEEPLPDDLGLLSPCPDVPHVCKRIRQSYANWWLLVDGTFINLVQLRSLKNDMMIGKTLDTLSLAACRNRDRMCVGSLLEITSQQVCDKLDAYPYTVNTLIPEPFRVCTDNKRGVLQQPTAVCSVPGGFVICDRLQHKLFKCRMHYPVDINSIPISLKFPMDLTYDNDSAIIFVADTGNKRIAVYDMGNSLIKDCGSMTSEELKSWLKHLGINMSGLRLKKDFSSKLKEWKNKELRLQNLDKSCIDFVHGLRLNNPTSIAVK